MPAVVQKEAKAKNKRVRAKKRHESAMRAHDHFRKWNFRTCTIGRRRELASGQDLQPRVRVRSRYQPQATRVIRKVKNKRSHSVPPRSKTRQHRGKTRSIDGEREKRMARHPNKSVAKKVIAVQSEGENGFDMSLRPKDERGLAQNLLHSCRTFTRRFVRTIHKSWLKKHQSDDSQKVWLIDLLNQRLKDEMREVKENRRSMPSFQIQSKIEPFTDNESPFHPFKELKQKKSGSNTDKLKSKSRVKFDTQIIKEDIKKTKKDNWQHRQRRGLNIIESEVEDYRKPIRRPGNQNRILNLFEKFSSKQQKFGEQSDTDKENVVADKPVQLTRKKDHFSKLNSKYFKRDYKNYLKQINGEIPYEFPNLGLLNLHAVSDVEAVPETKEAVEHQLKERLLRKSGNNRGTTLKKLEINAMKEELINKSRRSASVRERSKSSAPRSRTVLNRATKNSRVKKVFSEIQTRKPASILKKSAVIVTKTNLSDSESNHNGSIKRPRVRRRADKASKIQKRVTRNRKRSPSKEKEILEKTLNIGETSQARPTPKRDESRGLSKLVQSAKKTVFKEDLCEPKSQHNTNVKSFKESITKSLGKRAPPTFQSDHSEAESYTSPKKLLIGENKSTAPTKSKSKFFELQELSQDEHLHPISSTFKKTPLNKEKAHKHFEIPSLQKLGLSAESEYQLKHISAAKSSAKMKEESFYKNNVNSLLEKIESNAKASLDKGLLSRLSAGYRNEGLTDTSKKLISTIKSKSISKSVRKQSLEDKEIENILASQPPSKRYDDYLKLSSTVPLPPVYQNLVSKFQKLDEMLNFFRVRRLSGFIGNLQKALITTTHMEVKEIDLRKMLHVMPHAYHVKWERQNLHDYEMEILLNFPDSNGKMGIEASLNKEELAERKEQFKNSLYDMVKRHHDQFLYSIQESYDFKKNLQWHPRFSLEELTDIPAAILPSKPNATLRTDLKDFLENGTEKIRDIVYKVKKSCQKDYFSDTEENRLMASLEGGDSKLIAILKENEKANNIKKAMLQEKPFMNKVRELENLARNILVHFSQQKVNGMFLQRLVAQISKKSKDKILSAKETQEMVVFLSQIIPGWLQLVDNEQGQIIRINRQVNLSHVLSNLTSHFQTDK